MNKEYSPQELSMLKKAGVPLTHGVLGSLGTVSSDASITRKDLKEPFKQSYDSQGGSVPGGADSRCGGGACAAPAGARRRKWFGV